MARSRLALLLLLATQVGLFAAVARPLPGPAPEPASPTAYFPTALGTRWEYRLTDTGFGRSTSYQRIKRVTAVTEKDGARFLTVTESGNYDRGSVTEWWVSATGLRRRSAGRGNLRAWYTLLLPRIAPAVTWAEDRAEERAVLTVAGWEVLRVPAGEYRAVRIDFVVEDPKVAGEILTGAWWYAPGVGRVKQVTTGRDGLFGTVEELVAFQPGG